MATYKNQKPTIIQLPDGRNVMPGAEFEADDKTMENPAMRKWYKAGVFKAVDRPEPKWLSEVPPPPAPPQAPAPKADPAKDKADKDKAEKAAKDAQEAKDKAEKAAKAKAEKDAEVLRNAAEKAGKDKRDAKIAAIKTADAETLLKIADGETNADVIAALEARAAELAPK